MDIQTVIVRRVVTVAIDIGGQEAGRVNSVATGLMLFSYRKKDMSLGY